jgi:HSP20 family protein
MDDSGFFPVFDLSEGQDSYRVLADLPGVHRADLDITWADGRLTITGSRPPPTDRPGAAYHVSERSYGSFNRAFVFPSDADGDRVRATLEAGVLRLIVPKRIESRPRRIVARTLDKARALAERLHLGG